MSGMYQIKRVKELTDYGWNEKYTIGVYRPDAL